MAKNENHPRGSFDSLHEAFDALIATQKNLSSLQSPISDKISKNHKNLFFFQKCQFFEVFLDFSEMGLCKELRFFAL